MAGIIIGTDLEGKINNIPSFKSEALLPLFEAIVNSIHAIEDREDLEKGTIEVNIIRSNDIETSLGDFSDDDSLAKSDKQRKIVGFEIIDNGVGFNDENFESFNTADSTYKLDRGGKGIGRFLWLEAFDKVEIESVYGDNGTRHLRSIEFSRKKWVIEKSNDPFEPDGDLWTRVRLIGFKDEYRKEPSAYKTTRKIAQRILEHCLSYYIGGIAPTIIVRDGHESHNLDELYAKIRRDSYSEVISLQGEEYCIEHLKLFDTNNKVHNVVFCADKREVDSSPLQSLLGTSALFEDNDGGEKFYYSAYVSSSYLDQHVNMTRRSFDLPQDGNLHNIDGTCTISLNTIKNAVIEQTKAYLEPYIRALHEKKVNRVSACVSSYPTLRSVPLYCPQVYEEIEPNSSDEKIYDVLYKYKGVADLAIQQKAKKFLKKKHVENIAEIQIEYEKLSREIEDFKKDELASYICKRKMIIDLLDRKLELGENGKYTLEAEIHDIIFPRKCDTDTIRYEDHNLWVIDERLTFHEFASSDPRLDQISSSDSQKRPDIIIFSEINEDRIAQSVCIIELKRPERDDFDINPVAQMYNVIRDIRDRKVELPNGRHLLVGESTKYYCYAICDINDKITMFAEDFDLGELRDGLGYYTFNDKFNAYIEIIAFDRLITDVKKRHKIFFHKLGIPEL